MSAVLSLTLLVGADEEEAAKVDLRSAWTASIRHDERDLGTPELHSRGFLERALVEAVRRYAFAC